MRVPIPVVLLLCFAVLGATWWKWTTGKDFITPPSEQALEVVRREAAQATRPLPKRQEQAEDRKTAPNESVPPVAEPPFDPGDLVTAPGLNAYAPEARKGADHLIKLARRLEELGATARALLAWERVLDFGKGDPVQTAEALKAIRRLRPSAPMWNVDPEGALPLTLHLGASPLLAEKLKTLSPELGRTLERASGGVVAVTTDLVVGKKPAAGAEVPPVALWLSGGPKEAPSTEVLSVSSVSPEALEKELLGAVFQLIRAKLSKSQAYSAPSADGSTEDPAGALMFNITRFCWQDFGKAMNVVPPAAVVPAAASAPKPAAKPAAKPITKPASKPATPAKPKPRPVKPSAQAGRA